MDAVHTPKRELVKTVSLPFTEVCYSYLVLLLIHVLYASLFALNPVFLFSNSISVFRLVPDLLVPPH